jgi:hypothetical protein
MAIIRAAVGGSLQEFGESVPLADVWAFVNLHMASSKAASALS